MDDTSRTWAQISMEALENNYTRISQMLPENCGYCVIVKADAYGHGAPAVARRLQQLGARYMAVATAAEAVELRESGITAPILVLGACPPNMVPEMASKGITLSVGDRDTAAEFSRRVGDRTLTVHVKVDTGMSRMGIVCVGRLEEAAKEVSSILKFRNLRCEGIFTHFSTSDELFDGGNTLEQLSLFNSLIDRVRKTTGYSFKIRHCANSGALMGYRESLMDMCRAGIALYGYPPGSIEGIMPVMTLKTRIVHIKDIPQGATVSYGRKFRAGRKTRVGVLPVGYADGLFRCLSGKLDVTVGSARARQIGRICMDMCMIDITDIDVAEVGSEVTVFGEGAYETAQTLADKAGTIPYEILCSVSGRVPRVVV